MDEKLRSKAITEACDNYGVSKQTIRSYLWTYLVAQDRKALAPEIKKNEKRELSEHEKNMRWDTMSFQRMKPKTN